MNEIQITVCGMGNAGMAIAADIGMMGFKVNAYEVSEFSSNLTPIIENDGINLSGNPVAQKVGKVKLNKVTDNPAEAIEGSKLIMISVPAQAHENVLKKLLPHLKEGQIILFNTGYWSSIRFNHLLEEKGLLNKVTLVESSIMPYLSGIIGPASVKIFNYKRMLKVSAWPASKNEEVFNLLKTIYPQFELAENILETNFYPGNMSVHAQIVLPKAEFFFDRAREFRFYNEVSESASKLVEAFDVERKSVADSFECETMNYLEWAKLIYELKGDSFHEAYASTEMGKRWGNIKGIYRVLEEDLCYSMIPLEQFANEFDIEVPLTTAMIEMLTVLAGVDYRSKALTLSDLGLGNMDKSEILEYINHGKKSVVKS